MKDLILATRHVAASLQPINESPVYVYVSRALRPEVFEKGTFDEADVKAIAWGEAYASLSDASKSK